MGKNIILRCFSLMIASALVLAGCGHDTRSDTTDPPNIVGGGGGPAAAAAAAAAAVAVGPGGAFPNNNFLLNPVTETRVTGRNNPTQIVTAGTRVYYIGGLAAGQNNGRLFVAEVPSPFAPNPVPTFLEVGAAAGSPEVNTFNNPFGLVALDPSSNTSDLFVSTGFNINLDGRIIRISNVTIAGGVATATFTRVGNNAGTGAIVNPAFLMIANGVNGATNSHLYWTEYVGAGAPGGRVRRIRIDAAAGANPVAEDIFQGLSFPAGLAHNGQDLYVCDSAGGANGQVLRTPLNFGGTVLNATSTDVFVVAPIAAEVGNAIARPFDITYDGRNGMFFTEGGIIQLAGFVGPTSPGPGTGRVRYLPTGSSEAAVVSTGLNPVGGIAATPLSAAPGTVSGLVFTEVLQLNGTVRRISVDTAAVVAANPEVIATGRNSPFDVAIINIFQPLFVVTENYFGGNPFGNIDFYSSTGN